MKRSADITRKHDLRSNFELLGPTTQKYDFFVDRHLCQFEGPMMV